MKNVLYVSLKTPVALNAPDHTDAIVAVSRARNAIEKVTGALLSTGICFAQILEGPDEGVDRVMDSIRRDPRHARIVTLRDGPVQRRAFRGWDLAYLGEASYVETLIHTALQQPDEPLHAQRLTRLMREFSRRPVGEAGRGPT